MYIQRDFFFHLKVLFFILSTKDRVAQKKKSIKDRKTIINSGLLENNKSVSNLGFLIHFDFLFFTFFG